MALSDMQLRQLRAKLDAKHIRTRKANGTDLHYVEGWHVISEANRIFGYDAWDRRTVATKCVSSSGNGQRQFAAYTAKVRITVRAGDITIVREGSGTGEGSGLTPGQAHEIALKSAETDATKRALATFGNPFGLALYDREQLGIRKRRDFGARPALDPWVVRSDSGAERLSFNKPSEFAAALRTAMSEARDIEMLFALWEQNVETVRAITRTLGQQHLQKSGIAPQLVAHLKQCAVALAKNASSTRTNSTQSTSTQQQLKGAAVKIDKSVCATSPASPVLSVDECPLTPTTCATRNPAGWVSRSAMSSQCHYAPLTTTTFTKPHKNESGGSSERSIRSSSPGLYGNKANGACLI
jgi:DNA recombination protein Rad52